MISGHIHRLFIPNTRLNLDLGDAANSTHVKLMPKWHPGKNQTWRFGERESFLFIFVCSYLSACAHFSLPTMNSRGLLSEGKFIVFGLEGRDERGESK